MRVVIANPVWPPGADELESLFGRMPTLTGWASAVRRAGAQVTVVQRAPFDADVARDDVRYTCVSGAGPPTPLRAAPVPTRWCRAIVNARPDVVHVNGLHVPTCVRGLRAALPPAAALVVQDHGGFDPYAASAWTRMWIRHGLRAADALLLASPGQADDCRACGLVPRTTLTADVMESSTTLRAMPAAEARARVALTGAPLIAWVGRLEPQKDPMTVLRGWSQWFSAHPAASAVMVFQSGRLEGDVRARIERDAALRGRVALAHGVPHADIAAYLSAADICVSGSRREGSGYAVIEALACGAVPVVTDIAPFRALTDEGRVGAVWAPGDARALAAALDRVHARPLAPQQRDARAWFEARLTWAAIGARACAIYAEVAASRAASVDRRPHERPRRGSREAPPNN